MPTPRNHAAIGAVNGKIYVIGGRVGAAFIALASDTSLVEVYDPATDTWGTPGARMPTTRSALAYGVYNNRIYVAGGEFQDPTQQTVFRTFEEYDPASNTWSILPPMAIARQWCRRCRDRKSVLCGQWRRAVIGNGRRGLDADRLCIRVQSINRHGRRGRPEGRPRHASEVVLSTKFH